MNDLLQFLIVSLIPQLSNGKNQKWMFQSFVFIFSLLCHHKLFVFRVWHYLLCFDGANIRNICEICKLLGKKSVWESFPWYDTRGSRRSALPLRSPKNVVNCSMRDEHFWYEIWKWHICLHKIYVLYCKTSIYDYLCIHKSYTKHTFSLHWVYIKLGKMRILSDLRVAVWAK